MVAVQLPEESAQLAATVPTAVLDEARLTTPVGIFAALVVSVTVMVQEPVRPTVTDAEQETAVEVAS